jgi:transglutaminase-like putative cysteine protease
MAAFCRAVGIPSRVVRGCLYTPEYGGSFGSHGWNEIYMGKEAGWIPIDVTIHEQDYVDSGHIRLGIVNTTTTVINYNEITVLDYTLR